MSEKDGKIDINSLPFEERARMYSRFVQRIGIGIGGEEEYTLRELGRQIIALHSLPEGEQKDQLRKKMGKTYDTLGQSKNPKVGEAVVDVIMNEVTFF